MATRGTFVYAWSLVEEVGSGSTKSRELEQEQYGVLNKRQASMFLVSCDCDCTRL